MHAFLFPPKQALGALFFFIEVIEGMIDYALLKIIKRTAPSSTEPGAAAYNAQVITSGGHRGCLG